MKDKVTLNKEQKLYVIPSNGGYSCYGFQVLYDKVNRLAEEYGKPNLKVVKVGTMRVYKNYSSLIGVATREFKRSGYRSKSDLIPQFIGREGERVEVIDNDGKRRYFTIGKSMGVIPCHLELKRKGGLNGEAISIGTFKKISFYIYNNFSYAKTPFSN
jgi:hypothetical protein